MKLLLTKKTVLLGLSLFLFIIIVGVIINKDVFDIPFLFSEEGATWIYIDRPFVMRAQHEGEHVSYRKYFRVEHPPLSATLTIRALKVADVYLDGKYIPPINYELAKWKGTNIVDFTGLLTPGMHELIVTVYNDSGPAVILAFSKPIKLYTQQGWEASYDEKLWTNAVPADKKKTPEEAAHFGSADKAFISLFPIYLTIFLAIFFITLYATSPSVVGITTKKYIPTSSNIRWLLLVFWGILAGNNILKVPVHIGMDVTYHYEYISYIIKKWSIPFANEGIQMFQSPLYYAISALLYTPLSYLFDRHTYTLLTRIIPLLCGLLQVELAYRATKYVFPKRQDVQIWGTIIGGFLPMNLYISQVVGNEPLSGFLSACAVTISIILLTSTHELISEKYFVFLGVALGLALLTKVTAVLLVPLTIMLIVYILYKRQQPLRYIIFRVLLVTGIIFVISGWYYIRNWVVLGRPFVGGWESTSWWQDPGYRTAANFLSFGQSLSAPIYSAVYGFWDSLYSTLWLDGNLSGLVIKNEVKLQPPWNYKFMLSCALLSIVPAVSMLIGIMKSISKPSEHRAQFFAICCIGVYYTALLYLYVIVPIWSTAKATYTLGLVPCYAILCVTGLDYLSKNYLLRAAINACLACWAVAAYCSYFVL